MHTFPTLSLAFALSLPLQAQVLSPTQSSAPQNSQSSGKNNTTINRHESKADSPHGQEIPIVDPTQKTITFQGRSYSLMDNNIGGQFEAYLASTDYASDAAKLYRANIEEILSLLSPLNPGGPDLKKAYTILEANTDYIGDGGICDSLANSIYSARLAMKGIGDKKTAIKKLEKEQQRLIYNITVLENKGELGTTKKVTSDGETSTTKTAKSTRFRMMNKRILEIEAIKKKYEASGTVSLTQSKIQYQAMMVQLFMQRRFQHVVMAARFYNNIYKDGDQKMRLKKGSETEKFFSEGMGVNPTVAGLDAAANEGIRKTQTLINAFENNLKAKRIHAASERLVEAYAIGEFVPCVQTLPIEKKQRIQQYVQDANDLVEALSAKELVTATELNKSLQEQASDYNASKANAYISGHKNASDGYVRDAKFALFDKDSARAKVAIENAVKLWPNNPAISKFNDALDAKLLQGTEEQDLSANTIKEFDRLVADKNYRAMVEEPRRSKFVFVLGSKGDQERLNTLQEITTSITEIEVALRKSNDLAAAGHPYAAWEAIYETQNKYYDDPKIANAKAQLIGKVGNFTNALAKAKELEESGITPKTGSALSWYLKAREIYPQSEMAAEGIQRIVDKQFK